MCFEQKYEINKSGKLKACLTIKNRHIRDPPRWNYFSHLHLSKFFQHQGKDPEVKHYLRGPRAKRWWWAEV